MVGTGVAPVYAPKRMVAAPVRPLGRPGSGASMRRTTSRARLAVGALRSRKFDAAGRLLFSTSPD